MDNIEVKSLIQRSTKIGQFIILYLEGGTQRSGRLSEINDDHIVTEVVEGFWRKVGQDHVPDVAVNKTYTLYDDIHSFTIGG